MNQMERKETLRVEPTTSVEERQRGFVCNVPPQKAVKVKQKSKKSAATKKKGKRVENLLDRKANGLARRTRRLLRRRRTKRVKATKARRRKVRRKQKEEATAERSKTKQDKKDTLAKYPQRFATNIPVVKNGEWRVHLLLYSAQRMLEAMLPRGNNSSATRSHKTRSLSEART